MRKILLILLVAAVGLWAAQGTLLELKPAVGDAPSEYRVVKYPSLDLQTHGLMKGSKDIGQANYIMQYEVGDFKYYFPYGEDDSILVWFDPPAKCSVVAITNYWYWTAGFSYDLTIAFSAPGVSLTDYEGFGATATPGPSPTGTVLWHNVETSPAAEGWDTVNIPPLEVPDVSDSSFVVMIYGSLGGATDSFATLGQEVREPPPNHSLIYSQPTWNPPPTKGWYSHYYAAFGIRAYVKAYEDIKPIVKAEELPYSYDTGVRTVYVYCYDFTPAGGNIDSLHLHYSVNGGSDQVLKTPTLEDGTTLEGIWSFGIPAVGAGDTVDYYVIGYDPPDPTVLADTSGPYTYEIMAGNPGHFLYVDNGYTLSEALPDHYTDIIDVWDFDAYGAPDSAVFAFYSTGNDTQRTVIWRDWGCVAIGKSGGYGLYGYNAKFPNVDITRTCSTSVKKHLEAGGNFWLSDEDQGYGLGTCPSYEQVSVPAGHWVREYLGIQGMFDDNDSLIGRSLNALYGFNPILADLFSGSVGYQTTAGQIYIAPYAPITGDLAYAYVGSFDSLQAGAQMNMYWLDAGFNSYIISYTYLPPAGGKVYNDFWPFDYICNPADSTEIDEVAVDTLVQDVLRWFGVKSGISDETLEPGKLVKLLPVGLVTGEAMIRFSLPKRMAVSLDIYDNTGRLVKNLVKGEIDGGLHTYRWNAKVAAGVYFYHLTAGDKTLINKMVVIR